MTIEKIFHALGFHNWEEWELIQTYTITRGDKKDLIGHAYIYKRQCKICKKPEYRKKTIEIL